MANVFARLVVELAASIGTFSSDLKKATKEAEEFKNKTEAIGEGIKRAFEVVGIGLSVAELASSLKEVINQADEFSKLSQKVGVGVESLQELNYAAKLSDVSTEELGDGLKKLAVKASQAAGGNEEASKSFEKLGINIRDTNGQVKSNDDLFKELAGKFAGYQDGINKTAQAVEFFGKNGAKLIPLLNSGADGLDKMAQEARKLGIIMSAEDAKAAEEFNDNLTRLSTAVDGVKVKLVGGLLAALVDVSNAMVDTAKNGDALTQFGEGIGEVFKTITVLGLNVGYVFKQIGNELGGLAAQAVAVAHLDFKGAGAIGDAMKEDAEKARKEIDRISESILNPPKQATYSNEGRQFLPKPKQLQDAPAVGNPKDNSSKEQQTLKLKLAEELKLIETFIKAEEDVYASRNMVLDQYFQQNYISIEDYFSAKRTAQDEDVKNVVAGYDREIAALENYKKKADQNGRIEADTKITELSAKRAEVVKKASQESVKSFFEETKATKDYQNSLVKLDADLADIEGDHAASVTLTFDIQNEKLMKQLLLEGNAPGLEKLQKIKLLTVSNAEVKDLQDHINAITSMQEDAEKRISLDVQTGAISELEGLNKTSQARDEAVQKLKLIAEQWQEIADRTGDPKIQQGLAMFNTQIKELESGTNLLAKKFEGIFEDSFSSFFTDIISGTKSVSDAFKDMANNIVMEITKIATHQIAMQIFGDSGGSGGGGILGSLIGSALGYFTGAGPSPGGYSDPVIFSAKGNVFENGNVVQKFALGGAFTNGVVNSPTNFNIGQMGEAGPEAIVPLARGSDGRLGIKSDGAKKPSDVINFNMTVYAQDVNSFNRSQNQILANASRALQNSRRNM